MEQPMTDEAGTGASVAVGAEVDKISLFSGSAHGATTISRCAVPSGGRDNVAAGIMSRSAAATTYCGDLPEEGELEWTGIVAVGV
jgi:hypothetical protein